MSRSVFPLSLLILALACPAFAQEANTPASTVTLNGVLTRVHWTDGDSFQILDGEYARRDIRLTGFNALESYGPVHRWGEWTSQELYALSHQAPDLGRQTSWTCTTDGSEDHYGRLLVTCDDLVLAMVSAGLGLLFYVDGSAPQEQISAQQEAQTQGLGMWARGVPQYILTSLHSLDEGGDAYNRVVSTASGATELIPHSETYATCQEVCVRDSCMVYVPFSQRYGPDRAPCLREMTAGEGSGP